jgi:hypothetical protein
MVIAAAASFMTVRRLTAWPLRLRTRLCLRLRGGWRSRPHALRPTPELGLGLWCGLWLACTSALPTSSEILL